MLPLLYRNLTSQGFSDPWLDKLRRRAMHTWISNQWMLKLLGKTLVLLQENGIETLVLKGAALEQFLPQKAVLLAFNMGDGTAVVQWHALVWGGRLGFALKNYIDKTFMKNFQVSGELNRSS